MILPHLPVALLKKHRHVAMPWEARIFRVCRGARDKNERRLHRRAAPRCTQVRRMGIALAELDVPREPVICDVPLVDRKQSTDEAETPLPTKHP